MMGKLKDLFGPLRVVRIVSEAQVHCPVRCAEIDLERCFGCAFLADVVSDEQGQPEAIVCKPALSALVPVE